MSPRRPRLPLLFAAILLPCAALAAFGILSLRTDASQTETRYRQRAEGALDAAASAIEAAAIGLPAGVEPSLKFVASASGRLIDEAAATSRPESRPETRPDDGAAVDLLLSVFTEVDRLERAGDLSRAGARLGEFLNGNPPGDLAAAALTALAVIERKAGRVDAARAAWRRIVQEHPDARDARGLKRAFAARLALIDLDPRAQDDLMVLYVEVVMDDTDPTRPATGALKRELREKFMAGVPLEWDAIDKELALRRQLKAAFASGAESWIAAGGRGCKTIAVSGDTRAAADPRTDPVRVVVSARDGPDGNVTGGIAVLDAVIASALERREIKALEAVGFSVGLQSGGARGPAPPRSLGENLGGVAVSVTGADLETFKRQEQTRFWITAGLAGFGLLVATLAAIATARAVRREVAAVRGRENFVAAVTHELKAPLASIRLLAEVLSRGGVEEPKVREFADRAIDECDRLTRLVSSVLELARIEREPEVVMKLRTVDASALAEDVVRRFAPVAAKHGFAVSLRIVDPKLEIAGDRDALVGALLNLLDNAVKYSDEPGEVVLEVAKAGTHHASFAVLDRGRGVPASDANRIFEPFTRLGNEMTRDRPGAGLGLALVSRIASAHGGSASCKSRDGGGSRFTVVLPMARAAS